MGDEDLQAEVQTLKTHLEIAQKKIAALEQWRDSDAKPTLSAYTDERPDYAKMKWAQKLVDDLSADLLKKIKAVDDKVTALQKKVK